MKALLNVVVPAELVTAIAAIPAGPLGVTKVNCVPDATLTLVAADPATVTPVVPVKLLPVSVTSVAPEGLH